jgi:hypothetical protein
MARISRTEWVLKLVRQAGVVRPKDLTRHGIAPTYLQRLRERGLLTQAGGRARLLCGVLGDAFDSSDRFYLFGLR